MTIVDRQGHVVTQGAFNHCMAALDEARGRAKQLSEDWDSLASRMQTLRKAAQLYREASIQDHAEHCDSKQTGGASCPVCLRASELRLEADALVDIANAAGQGAAKPYPEPACSASLVAQPPRDVSELYHELLYAVARKSPGESRHETALRYIRDAEDRACQSGSCKQNTSREARKETNG